MGAISSHGIESFYPIWPKPNVATMMLQMKVDCDLTAGLKDIFMFESVYRSDAGSSSIL